MIIIEGQEVCLYKYVGGWGGGLEDYIQTDVGKDMVVLLTQFVVWCKLLKYCVTL